MTFLSNHRCRCCYCFMLVVLVLANWANVLPRDPGHTYVKRAPRWAGSQATAREGTDRDHPRHPPMQRWRETKIHKKYDFKILYVGSVNKMSREHLVIIVIIIKVSLYGWSPVWLYWIIPMKIMRFLYEVNLLNPNQSNWIPAIWRGFSGQGH